MMKSENAITSKPYTEQELLNFETYQDIRVANLTLLPFGIFTISTSLLITFMILWFDATAVIYIQGQPPFNVYEQGLTLFEKACFHLTYVFGFFAIFSLLVLVFSLFLFILRLLVRLFNTPTTTPKDINFAGIDEAFQKLWLKPILLSTVVKYTAVIVSCILLLSLLVWKTNIGTAGLYCFHKKASSPGALTHDLLSLCIYFVWPFSALYIYLSKTNYKQIVDFSTSGRLLPECSLHKEKIESKRRQN